MERPHRKICTLQTRMRCAKSRFLRSWRWNYRLTKNTRFQYHVNAPSPRLRTISRPILDFLPHSLLAIYLEQSARFHLEGAITFPLSVLHQSPSRKSPIEKCRFRKCNETERRYSRVPFPEQSNGPSTMRFPSEVQGVTRRVGTLSRRKQPPHIHTYIRSTL